MDNVEMVEKAAKEIFHAETPEEVEFFVKFIALMFLG